MTETAFVPSAYSAEIHEGKTTYRAPSNIALVKYWGKKENQVPANPSISFTLDACATTTTVSYRKLDEKAANFSFDFEFEGRPKEDFKPKIITFFARIEPYLPFLRQYHFRIETSNSFPHSSGIASSASGMAALSLCLMHLERQLNPAITDDFFNRNKYLFSNNYLDFFFYDSLNENLLLYLNLLNNDIINSFLDRNLYYLFYDYWNLNCFFNKNLFFNYSLYLNLYISINNSRNLNFNFFFNNFLY